MRGNLAVIRKILHYIRRYGILLIISLLLATGYSVLALYLPVLTGRGVDAIVSGDGVDYEGLGNVLITMLIMVAIAGICQWIMNIINNRITFAVVRDIREDAFAHLQQLPLSYYDDNKSGDIVSRIINDVDQFADGLLLGFTQFFTSIVTILGTLIFMLYINVKIAIVVVLVTPLSLLVSAYIAKSSHDMFAAQARIKGRQTAYIDEMITGEKVLKAYGREEEAVAEFNTINDELKVCSLKAVFFSSLTNPTTRFVNGIVYACVAGFGGNACVRGLMTVGELTSFLGYANQYTKPFNEISGVVTELQNALACAERIFELLETKTQSPDGTIEVGQLDGNVDFENVSFSYTQDKPLIEHFSLKVASGQHIAIVGPTGCGKTTLINLIMRFYDVQSGSIQADGRDIKDIPRQQLRENIGMVLQDTWLRHGTIMENIRIGRPEASKEEVIEAAKRAHAHNFIMKMKDGYDTCLGADGGILSQGQKQLICIARVMLALPPILILDEATSSIDTRTEMKIQKAFMNMIEGRTSFIVAHRLSTVREADNIIVMRDGHIVEQGRHQELINSGGFYSRMYKSAQS